MKKVLLLTLPILGILILIASVMYIISAFFYNDYYYDKAIDLDCRPDSFSRSDCYYPDCDRTITHRLYSDDIIIQTDTKMMVKKLIRISNKTGMVHQNDSASYTEKNKNTYYDKGTYLVPQDDGSFKVEEKTNKYDYYTNGKTTHYSKVSFEGYYCDQHKDIASETWKQDVEKTLHTNNVLYWSAKYGLWAMLALILLLIVNSVVSINLSKSICVNCGKTYYLQNFSEDEIKNGTAKCPHCDALIK